MRGTSAALAEGRRQLGVAFEVNHWPGGQQQLLQPGPRTRAWVVESLEPNNHAPCCVLLVPRGRRGGGNYQLPRRAPPRPKSSFPAFSAHWTPPPHGARPRALLGPPPLRPSEPRRRPLGTSGQKLPRPRCALGCRHSSQSQPQLFCYRPNSCGAPTAARAPCLPGGTRGGPGELGRGRSWPRCHAVPPP